MAFVVMEPDPMRRVETAIEDIRAGRMAILIDDEDRENEGDLVLAADAVTPEAINFMAREARGLICLSLTAERVKQLQLPMMAANNQSAYHTAFTVSIEAREGVTTGISAYDRAHTVRVAIDPGKGPADIVTPGHVFPLKARDAGVLARTGQTEGSVDLARLAGLTPAAVICEIMNDDGSMARLPDLERFAARHRLRIVTVADLIRWRMRNEVHVERVVDAPLKVRGNGVFQSRIYRCLTDGGLHLAVWKGELGGDAPVLARVQGYCPTGDVFGSASCDCRAQLDAAMQALERADRGVLLYLHLGGGAEPDSLLLRMRAHLGTLDAASAHSGGGELRAMGTGAQILVDLGVTRLRLMTNNPRKIVGLEGYGVQVVERVPLHVPVSTDNASFLRARRLQLGHLLPPEG